MNALALRLLEGALPGSGEEWGHAADRAAAGFREPVDRGGLNAGPLRPFSAETAGNGAEGGESAVSTEFPKQTETFFTAE